MTWLALRLFFGGALKSVIAALARFFGSLNAQGWIGFVACGLLAFLFIRAEGESRHWHKQSNRFEKLYNADHAELTRISSSRNQQQIVTREKIKIVTQRIHDADGKAKVIEQAPLPGQCKTPKEVLGADI